MKGSGLEELFEEVYSEDTVKHITSGHAVARALRAHLLVQSKDELSSITFPTH